MTENAIALIPTTDLALPQDATLAVGVSDQSFDDIITSYLPRLQLFDANSKPVKKKQITGGNYGIVVNDNITDLGEEVRCFVLSMRIKAMDISDGVLAYYDPNHAEFKRIMAKSGIQNSGCMCGPEFLLYLPDRRKFVTFYMSSKTARREAPNVKVLLGKACLLRSKFIETDKYSWYGPQALPCSTPMDPPPADRLSAELEKFRNPPAEETETVEAGEERER